MAHLVTCTICHKKFDRDIEPTVAVAARRYAHKICVEGKQQEIEQEEKDREALIQYINEKYKTKFVDPNIQKQIKDYQQKYGYTYIGILRALIYWYDIKENKVQSDYQNTIGIVPYVYKDAEMYYKKIESAKLNNRINQYKPKMQYIEIPSPRTEIKKIKLFNLDE